MGAYGGTESLISIVRSNPHGLSLPEIHARLYGFEPRVSVRTGHEDTDRVRALIKQYNKGRVKSALPGKIVGRNVEGRRRKHYFFESDGVLSATLALPPDARRVAVLTDAGWLMYEVDGERVTPLKVGQEA